MTRSPPRDVVDQAQVMDSTGPVARIWQVWAALIAGSAHQQTSGHLLNSSRAAVRNATLGFCR